MALDMVYYLAFEEDDWLDEILDYFREVNSVVPSTKTLQLMREQRANGVVENVLLVINVAHEKERSKDFLLHLQADDIWTNIPLYLVGVDEDEEAQWRTICPRAKVVVIRGSKYEFDYEAVLKDMKEKWSD
jgi:hypothetical protein